MRQPIIFACDSATRKKVVCDSATEKKLACDGDLREIIHGFHPGDKRTPWPQAGGGKILKTNENSPHVSLLVPKGSH